MFIPSVVVVMLLTTLSVVFSRSVDETPRPCLRQLPHFITRFSWSCLGYIFLQVTDRYKRWFLSPFTQGILPWKLSNCLIAIWLSCGFLHDLGILAMPVSAITKRGQGRRLTELFYGHLQIKEKKTMKKHPYSCISKLISR